MTVVSLCKYRKSLERSLDNSIRKRASHLFKTCATCSGAGGEYWMAPVYHNERVREWSRCGDCGGSGKVPK